MRYIQKSDTPQFFKDDTKNLQNWKEYKEKRKLKKFLLENEQDFLCCYCEGKVDLDSSHIEHIKPKSLDIEKLTFDYKNLVASCNGICNNNEDREYCGHKKENNFDEDSFLNPTKVENIREYFIYNIEGEILPSKMDKTKSKYTIDLLQLNTSNSYLQEARKKSLEQFRLSARKKAQNKKENIKGIVKNILDKENLPFISFLRFHYE